MLRLYADDSDAALLRTVRASFLHGCGVVPEVPMTLSPLEGVGLALQSLVLQHRRIVVVENKPKLCLA